MQKESFVYTRLCLKHIEKSLVTSLLINALFRVYMCSNLNYNKAEIKHYFHRMGDELFPGSSECFELTESHVWFNKAVARWLDIALYKAMQRIIKAVDLDDLSPVDDLVQHSSSAVDIRTVLMQIKTFWAQLCWPDVESSYAYISKILDVSLKFLS